MYIEVCMYVCIWCSKLKMCTVTHYTSPVRHELETQSTWVQSGWHSHSWPTDRLADCQVVDSEDSDGTGEATPHFIWYINFYDKSEKADNRSGGVKCSIQVNCQSKCFYGTLAINDSVLRRLRPKNWLLMTAHWLFNWRCLLLQELLVVKLSIIHKALSNEDMNSKDHADIRIAHNTHAHTVA